MTPATRGKIMRVPAGGQSDVQDLFPGAENLVQRLQAECQHPFPPDQDVHGENENRGPGTNRSHGGSCQFEPGKGPMPKINKGSKMKLTVTAINMMALGVLVSPVARIALFPTIGTTTKIIPGYQICMYCLTKGKISGVAPSIRKTGSMVNRPTTTNTPTIRKDKMMLSVVKALDFSFVAFTNSPGNNRRSPDPQAQCQAGDNHYNGGK